MNIVNMTDEQKYWYLRGYLESFIHSVSFDMNISEDVVRKWVVNNLATRLKIDINN